MGAACVASSKRGNSLSSKGLLCRASRKRAFTLTKLQKIVHATKHYLNIFFPSKQKNRKGKIDVGNESQESGTEGQKGESQLPPIRSSIMDYWL